MKNLKMLVVATTAALSLSALISTGPAMAEKLCTEQKQECPAGKHESTNSVTQRSLKSTFRIFNSATDIDTCTERTIKGKTTNTAAAGERIKYKNETYLTAGCTFPTSTTNPGREEIANISGTTNGTLFGSEIEVTINTSLFGSCIYAIGTGTDMGTVVGGNPATVQEKATASKVSGSAFACPSTATFEAEYMVTEPKPIWISKN